MKYLLLTGLVVLFLIQWLVPLNMIRVKYNVLKEGKIFRFETQPIDPSMPFTGKYVQLSFKISEYRTISKDSLKTGEEIFVLLQNDSAGFAKVAGITSVQPSDNIDFVQATCGYTYKIADTLYVNINFPFTAFYMDEYKAPAAETEYREASLDSTKKAFALISLLNGEAVIKDVIIDDRSLKDRVKQRQK
jgi:hypothetical protein